MFTSNWRKFIATVGLVFLASLGQAQEQTQSPQGDAGDQQEPAQTLPIPLPVQIIEDNESSKARERREAEAAQREKDDLVAQQGMNSATQSINEATQRMMWTAWVSAGLAALATTLLVWTLLVSRQSNKAALKTAKAAFDSNVILRREQRPWLRFEIEMHEGSNVQQGKFVGVLVVTIKNAGRSPAYAFSPIGILIDGPASNDLIVQIAGDVIALLHRFGRSNWHPQVVFPDDSTSPQKVTIQPEYSPRLPKWLIGESPKKHISIVVVVPYGTTADEISMFTARSCYVSGPTGDNTFGPDETVRGLVLKGQLDPATYG